MLTGRLYSTLENLGSRALPELRNTRETDALAYYDRIAKQWHRATGHSGGAFKRYVLNNQILSRIGSVEGRAILELGAGNGYFVPLLLRRFSGQTPKRIVVTDASDALLDIAQREFRVAGAEYLRLDLRQPFPFPDASFDLLFATMVFNEVSTPILRRALAQCARVITEDGLLVATVTHPDFLGRLSKQGALRRTPGGGLLMPGAGDMRLPIARRSKAQYGRALLAAGFTFVAHDIHPGAAVLKAKPGLRHSAGVPLALLLECRKRCSG
ncbi:MAG: class I SAM-dependent methyltransferase [Verrucomicrobia bacterium]|nr:class I SAM-dependent methyltransferase [Verrucomicrobiota bacterium]